MILDDRTESKKVSPINGLISLISEINQKRSWEKNLDIEKLNSTIRVSYEIAFGYHHNQRCKENKDRKLLKHLIGTTKEGIKVIKEFELAERASSTLLAASMLHHRIAYGGVELRYYIRELLGAETIYVVDTLQLKKQFECVNNLPVLLYRSHIIDELKNIDTRRDHERRRFLSSLEKDLPLLKSRDQHGYYKIRELMP